MKLTAPRRCLLQGLAVLLAACVFGATAKGQRTSLRTSVAALPAGATDTGALPGSQPISLTLYLAPTADRAAALATFLNDLQTPGTAAYHAWLTPAEFGQQFGATAAQIAAVSAFAQSQGLMVESVSASGLRVAVSGTVAQVEAAFAPALHGVQLGKNVYAANTAAPSLPANVADDVVADLLAVDGLDTLPSAHPLTLTANDGPDSAAGAQTANDALAAISPVVDANTTRVISLSTTSCLEDVDAASQSAMELTLEQASAQGMTVLAQTGCGPLGSAGFPSILAEVTSVAVAPGITPPATANLSEARPAWQLALGLPADNLRHEPDLTVSSLAALAQTVESILVTEPAGADGTAARLGNINTTLYELAPTAGLYTQPDQAAPDTWEAPTGLGLVDLQMLAKVFPRGSLSDNVSIDLASGYIPHGTPANFSSTVTDTSGQGNGVVPTGTVTFSTNTGVALGSATLSGGTGSVNYSQLAGGTYTVTSAYSGDGTYAANNSIATGFTIAGEASQLSGYAVTNVPVGGTINVVITDKSGSGVGTPSGTVTVTPQGTSDTSTYTGTLSGSNGTATATVPLPAVQAGNIVLQVNCVSADPSFTCYNPISVTAPVTKGTPSMSFSVSPNPPVTGQTTTFSATVSGLGGKYPTPTGNVAFSDNGSSLGSATLNGSGEASITTSNLSSSTTHSFLATYGGDNNYSGVSTSPGTTSGATATTTTLTIAPNPPVSGSTTILTAAIGYTATNGATPTGNVSFYEDNVLLATEPVSGGSASYSSTALSGSATHSFYAVYLGDANYQTSTSAILTTAASTATATTTTLTIAPNPPVSGSTTILTAAIGYTATNGATPTGSVKFYEDGVLLATEPVSAGAASYSSTGLSSTTTHSFYAVYLGDTNYQTSTSPTVATSASTATVTTTATLTVSPNPPVSGSMTTLTASIAFTGSTSSPTGTVSFYEDGALLITEPVSNGAAVYSSTALSSTAAHTFYAVYSGDTTFKASTSATVATAASSTIATTTTLTVSPNPPVSGNTTTLTAAIAYTNGNGHTPTGGVNFYEDGALLASAAVSGGTAVYPSTALTSKTAHSFYAAYSGDSNFAASTSATVATAASTAATTTTTVSSSSGSVATGGTALLSATVTPSSIVNSTAPTGTVAFTSATQGLLCSGAVSNNAASCTATFTVAGAQSITAAYSGDANYGSSSSTAPAVVNVGATTAGALTLSVTPNTSAMYGGTVTLASTLTGTTTSGTSGPSGSVSFALSGAAIASYSAALTPISATASTASTAIPTPAPGTYTVTATCASTNVTCTNLSAAASLVTIKGNTTTTLTASPTSPLAGQQTTFTVVVAPAVAANGSALAPTGTVTFYINSSTAVATETLVNGLAMYSTVLTGTTGNNVTAVYSGDTNWNASTSSTLDVVIAPLPTTLEVSSNLNSALQGSNVVLTVSLSVTPNAVDPTPALPGGTISFYDLYNGLTTELGSTSTLAPAGPYNVIGQFSTTGLMKGVHDITAYFGATTNYAASTASIQIDITDYGVTFAPATLSLTSGASGATVATITAYGSFTGQVTLACTPPAGTSMTCNFSPETINGSGTSLLSVGTAANTALARRPSFGGKSTGVATGISMAAISLSTLLLGLLLPGARRRRSLLLALVATAILFTGAGCTQVVKPSSSNQSGGTPLGTQLLSITTSGNDGVTTNRHDYQFQVTVQ